MIKFLGSFCILGLVFSLAFAFRCNLTVYAGPMPVLSVAQPSRNTSSTGAGFNIFGTSDPAEELYMNSQPVANRTAEGFFSVFVPLSLGDNVFVFSQDSGPDVVRIITREPVILPAHPTIREAAITNVFPIENEYVSFGDIINFRATAPVGASVTVNFGGEILLLTPEHRFPNPTGSQIYTTTFIAAYEIPSIIVPDPIISLGHPVYTMEFGEYTSVKIGGEIQLISESAPFYATVTEASAWTFPAPTITGGPNWNVLRGQQATVKAISAGGDWVRLESGIWIQGENVSLRLENEVINYALTEGKYVKEEFTDKIVWRASHYPAIQASFDSSELRVYYALQTIPPSIDLSEIPPDEAFFSEISSGFHNGIPYHSFTISDTVNIEGYYVSFSDGEFTLNIRRRRTLTPGIRPLLGFRFVIDAGHGQQDYGALGPMGTALAEKDINLTIAGKLADSLSNFGAEVVQVRTEDVFYTLQERTEISRLVKPDMFLSIHADSTAETTDATNIHGISFWYRNPNSRPLAQHLVNELYGINPLTTRHNRPNQANFFVCRPVWAPSVIVEASFMNNIQDFAWLIDTSNQNMIAKQLAYSILSYYGHPGYEL